MFVMNLTAVVTFAQLTLRNTCSEEAVASAHFVTSVNFSSSSSDLMSGRSPINALERKTA